MRRRQKSALTVILLLAATLFLLMSISCEPTPPPNGNGCDVTPVPPADPGQGNNPPIPGAVDKDGYHEQRMQFVNNSDGHFLSADGAYADASITAASNSSALNQWVLHKAGNDAYQIINAASGGVLAPSGNNAAAGASVVAASRTSGNSQYWKLVPAQKDSISNTLSYKIVNSTNTSLALTLNGGAYILSADRGADAQSFRLNSYGAQGFAGPCLSMNGREVASITGGVLGSIVYASNLSQLQSYAANATPYTIVINNNISASRLTKVEVGKNKTFIGSYGNKILDNIHFRCISNSGNIIFKNITFNHSSSINANDDIQVYISDGNKFWLDHCTFTGHTRTTSSDVDKFIYVGLYADYVSVTGCKFGIHKYGLILGYYNDNSRQYAGYPRMTIANNYFNGTQTRAPGLMRYGYFHSYNNFVYDFHLGYTPYTGSNVYSENNYFDKGSQQGAVIDEYPGVGAFTDSGSVLSSSINVRVPQTSWRPNKNYTYSARPAAGVPQWCRSHAGSQSSSIVYAID